MNRIGVLADSFRVGVIEGLKLTREVGAAAAQLYIGGRGATKDIWTKERRKEVLACAKDNGLVISAMCGDMGGHGFELADENTWRVDETFRMMDLCRELECGILTTHIGRIPADKSNPRWEVMRAALERLSKYGKDCGCGIAIETGPEQPETLLGFINAIDYGCVGVNYDPANLVMVQGIDAADGARTLAGHILHTHAKDGRMLKFVGGEEIYGFFAEGGIGDLRMEECFLETPLGDGDVDFPKYVKALDDIGYTGYYTIEREVGQSPRADIEKAVGFLKGLI